MASSFDNAAHVRNLANSLNVQRKNGAFCDVLLKVSGGQTLPTHSCILTACSPYFEELICGEYGSGPPRLLGVPMEVVLDLPQLVASRPSITTAITSSSNDHDDAERLATVVLDLLDYIYTGKIELTADSARLAGQLADAFMLEGLSSLINEYVIASVSPSVVAAAAANESSKLVVSRSTSCVKSRRRTRKVPPKKRTPVKVEVASAVDLPNRKLVQADDVERVVKCDDERPEVRVLRSRKRVLVEEVDDDDVEGDEDDDEASSNELEEGAAIDPSFAPDTVAKKSCFSSNSSKRMRRSTKKCTFKCGECEFASENQQAIRDHKRIHNRSRAYVCVSCGFFTGRCAVLLAHLLSANHPEKECSLCGFVAGDRATFRQHLQRHDHRKLPFFCQLCDMRCRARSMLEKHVAKHAATRAFVCDICGNGFKLKQGLNTHMQTHTAAKNFSCGECDFRTAYKTNLQMHVRKHNGSMFKCTQDGCTFQSNSKHNLQSHVVTHAKLKPYQCEVCGQKFAQERNLRRHAKIHDPDANLMQCDICRQFTTTRRDRFSAHIKKCGTTTTGNAASATQHSSAGTGNENQGPPGANKHGKKNRVAGGGAAVVSGDDNHAPSGGPCLIPVSCPVGGGVGIAELSISTATNEYAQLEHVKMCHPPPPPPPHLHQSPMANAPPSNPPPISQFEKPMMDYAPRMYWFP